VIAPVWLACGYGISEFAIAMLLRSKVKSSHTDRGSLRKVMVIIYCSVFLAVAALIALPTLNFSTPALYAVGVAIFVFGIALRWYSIATLGRFFTVDVAIAPDQTVIQKGPYRFLRHPSYTGALLAFLGLGLCFANPISLVLFVVPPTLAFLLRIQVEEEALQAGLGDAYSRYIRQTKRLIPFVY
jgi:protein-S-isoprenylcysteine O-methyltransferase